MFLNAIVSFSSDEIWCFKYVNLEADRISDETLSYDHKSCDRMFLNAIVSFRSDDILEINKKVKMKIFLFCQIVQNQQTF